ncbi:hypothetical protein RUM44_006064 [Polyplax serrata]|uniref:SH2 domain-containing protein n=1 Tax=Polyplax serrata TaxID=468196 RepID=A0ABR1AYV7_POLSC
MERDSNFLGRELGATLRASRVTDQDSASSFHPVERKPSPYYYSDLLNQDELGPSAFKSYRKPEPKPPEPVYSQSSKQVNKQNRELESYHPFSAKENFEPKQGGLDFYDFASGRVRKKHRVLEAKGNTSKKKHWDGCERKKSEECVSSVLEADECDSDGRKKVKNYDKRQAYVKSTSLDVPPLPRKVDHRKECIKSASLDIPLTEDTDEDVGEQSNKFRPIVPVKDIEEGIEGGDEEEEEVKRDRKKSLKKLGQHNYSYNYNYKDCLTGAPIKTFACDDAFSPAEILQHVINSGNDTKSLLAACLAEWDAHARLMRPLTARALTQCACAIGAQKEYVSSDEEEGYHYSRSALPINSGPVKISSQDSIRRRDFFKEPIPDGKNLGDEFLKGKKVASEGEDSKGDASVREGSVKSDKSLNAREIFCNWGIIVNEKGGFESWNDAYDEHSDSAEAYRIAREILEETENWGTQKNSSLKQECRSAESLDDLDNMSRRGLLYETAFDSKVSRSDDDLEELDRVTNHPVLHSRIGRSKSAVAAPLIESYTRPPRPGSSFSRSSSSASAKGELTSGPKASADEKKHTEDIGEITDRVQQISIVQTPTPPSTAPLPSKFCGHDDFTMNSIRSAPELSTTPSPMRVKDTRLPVKSLRARDSRPTSLLLSSNEPLTSETKYTEPSKESLCQDIKNVVKNGESITKPKLVQNPGLILEIKSRPDLGPNKKLRVPRPRSLLGDMRPVLNQRKGRLKFSSTESMATSSSGGSMESIKSSTSEGNRSTSSSESHRSSSLSSHSSDSVGNVVAITTANLQYHLQQTNPHHNQNNKMHHALSPISDKSSVDPVSETSDNNKNNNSQKSSPEETEQQTNGGQPQQQPQSQQQEQQQQQQHHPPKFEMKLKRRALQNKNLINLELQNSSSSNEAQGSDSGISVESRTARSSGISFNQTETDFSDLPFDMPKLRRRRQAEQDGGLNRRLLDADACTSSSATSVDLRDLPFDMPKLRRRLRPGALCESQASSSQSVAEQSNGGVLFRPSMTLSLDLESNVVQSRGLSLNLERGRGCGTMTLGAFTGVDLIDPSLPLEKQVWYHGAITRVEAESLLRTLKEGSYLVRNSESTRQDYSLSLKSAKGFMHMRIQMDNSGQFILGQFSKPFDSIPDMIRHYSINRLPIRGAEHMCLLKPVAAQLL